MHHDALSNDSLRGRCELQEHVCQDVLRGQCGWWQRNGPLTEAAGLQLRWLSEPSRPKRSAGPSHSSNASLPNWRPSVLEKLEGGPEFLTSGDTAPLMRFLARPCVCWRVSWTIYLPPRLFGCLDMRQAAAMYQQSSRQEAARELARPPGLPRELTAKNRSITPSSTCHLSLHQRGVCLNWPFKLLQ